MPKRKCTFNTELQKKFLMFKKEKFDWEVLCTICDSKILIANKGVTDINDHIATLKHKMRFQSQAGTSRSVMETYIPIQHRLLQKASRKVSKTLKCF